MLLSCCALGLSHATAGLAARFCRPYLVAAERTRWADERVRAHYRRLDGRMIEPDGSFPLVAALLERGSLVTVPFDMPPARRRPAPVSGAAARLAMATGALVVPAAATRRGHRLGVALASPLDPSVHDGADALHARLAVVHRRFVLARPEAYRGPLGVKTRAASRPEPERVAARA